MQEEHDEIDLSDLPQNIQELNGKRRRYSGDPWVDALAAGAIAKEQKALAAMVKPIELSSTGLDTVTGLRRIIAIPTHTLLAYGSDQGILFYDRRSGSQHLWTWNDIRAIIPPIE